MKELSKYALTLTVLWPLAADSVIEIVDTHGEVVGVFGLKKPMLGSELSRLVPESCSINLDAVSVSRLSGPLVRSTRLPFDTVVNTERKVVSVEDRMARLENRVLGAERRSVALAKQLRAEKAAKLHDEFDVLEAPDESLAEVEPLDGADDA